MLIINADDLGQTAGTTASIIDCYEQGLVTSASAMVFMRYSQQAAELARFRSMETGLHLNLTVPFDAQKVPSKTREYHTLIVRYFRRGKWAQWVYNPLLAGAFDYVFKAQHDEYRDLFGREPAQIDGHHHMHLCVNMIVDRIIPQGLPVRRNFTFKPGEKNFINRMYRRMIDAWLMRHYQCTDSFFSIEEEHHRLRLQEIVSLAYTSCVELMVHPGIAATYNFLKSEEYRNLIKDIPKGNYLMLC
jgi:predicted glycoside hydrolase/deacetylase ChbG (UPF0249 family)